MTIKEKNIKVRKAELLDELEDIDFMIQQIKEQPKINYKELRRIMLERERIEFALAK
jgi:hypothetical protein